MQAGLAPVTVPGVAGAVAGETNKVCAAELPQVLVAFTVMLPVVPPVVTEILFVVELPVQPFGSTHS